MDKESIYRLGLEFIKNVDLNNSNEIYNRTNSNHIIVLKLFKDDMLVCPYCGQVNTSIVRSSSYQEIKHASAIENNITIKLRRRKYLCSCGHTFLEDNPFTDSKKKTSLQKDLRVLETLRNMNRSFSDVAKEFKLSESFVIKLFDNKVDIKRQRLTQVISVDEVYAKHCGYKKYCFIVYSPQLKKILDVLPSRNKEYLCRYFGLIPMEERKKVLYFSIDLYETYREVAKLCFTNALVCVDHFHVVKNIGDAFNKARIRIMKKYEHLKNKNDNWYWLYKRYWKLLLKNPSDLSFKRQYVNRYMMLDQYQIVEYMLSIDQELKEAYKLLNDYKDFNSNKDITPEAATIQLDDLILDFHYSVVPEYKRVYKMLSIMMHLY